LNLIEIPPLLPPIPNNPRVIVSTYKSLIFSLYFELTNIVMNNPTLGENNDYLIVLRQPWLIERIYSKVGISHA
jgi:hypothetical protein